MPSRPMSLAVTLAALAGVSSSCRNALPSPAPTPLIGTFDFSASTPRGEIRGVVHVLSDTVLVEFESAHGSCRSLVLERVPKQFVWECADVGGLQNFTIVVDRWRGLRGSRWYGGYQSDDKARCEESYVTAPGQSVCTRMGTASYQTTAGASGVLHLHRRASAPP